MRAIHQLIGTLTPYDAVSNEALEMQEALRGLGYESELYGEDLIGPCRARARPLVDLSSRGDAAILLHYSTWSSAAVRALQLPNPLLVRYHNVTPPEWFVGVNDLAARTCGLARAALPALAERATLALADSEFNRQELVAAGFRRTAVLPILMQEGPVGEAESGLEPLILTVGRIAPNKRIDEILRVFALFQRACRPDASLAIVGSGRYFELYHRACRKLADELEVRNVRFTGIVSQADKNALYARASAYLCLSEHEGFGVPLVEAMRWGIPILARARAAVPETLGSGGIVVDTRSRAELAELLDLVVSDEPLRAEIRAGQRRELTRFESARVRERLCAFVAEALG
jgi:L-malate glycosyltransferase